MNPNDATDTIAKPAPGQRADARRNHESVLEAARKGFARYGWECQMDDIAKAAGVGVGTVYRHFPTKVELLDALIALRFERLAARAKEAVAAARTGDSWAAFEDFIRYSAEYSAGDKALSEAMASRAEKMSAAAEESGLVAQVELLLKETKRTGGLRKDLAVEDIPAMVCSIGSVSLAMADKPRMRWERVLAIWLDGVRAPGAKRLPAIPG